MLASAKEADKTIYGMMAAGIYAGLRYAEIINLKWKNIDFEKQTITVTNTADFKTKTRRQRIVPLHRELKSILKELPANGEYIFTYKKNTPYKSHTHRPLKRVEKLSGIQNINFLVFRRTFGSILAQEGVSILKIAKFLGHTGSAIAFKHYAYLQPQFDEDIHKI